MLVRLRPTETASPPSSSNPSANSCSGCGGSARAGSNVFGTDRCTKCTGTGQNPQAQSLNVSIGCQVELHGLEGAHADKNGLRAQVVSWDSDKNKWQVTTPAGRSVLISEPFLRITAGPQVARGQAQAPGTIPSSLPEPSAWANGLSPSMQREWLVDCYRMRVDDDYAWGGGNLRGLYNVTAGGGGSVAQDFFLFCKLAVRKAVIPPNWDWAAFLVTAEDLLRYAFEKEDAQEKYGSENVFNAAMGGRSLRYTAEMVYGSSCMAMEESDAAQELEDTIERSFNNERVFDDVGGVVAWRAVGLGPRERVGRQKGGGKASGKGSKGALTPCRFWQAGYCTKGEQCRFSHAGPKGQLPVCRYWQVGTCTKGASCQFGHV
ncbi:unnamed protein product [Polarella glacialis]|uniref:C3H1-type domain-containing protein n=1 Tax=Polarella glacialis TaxID=89957 RepID=A0A813G4B1_POLGL|nr:unnamed protein product [Polarella glacialis]